MITLIIILVIICGSFYLVYGYNSLDFNEMLLFIGVTGGLIGILCLAAHLLTWGFVEHSYNVWVERRTAFELTLNNARETGNQYEVAAIVKEVANWNESLAENKYLNTHWFFDQYIDDRVKDLEPIK